MAFVHYESQECTKSELDLFTIPATQTSIAKGQWIEFHPLSNITDTGPVKFNVSGTGEEYLDLAKTQLLVKAKITKENGTALDAETKVGPMNLFLHFLFSQVDVSLNERLISASTNTYPYRAMIETLFNYGETRNQVNYLWPCFTKVLLERWMSWTLWLTMLMLTWA